MQPDGIDVDTLLDRHRDRTRRMVRAILAEQAGEDPFRVSLDRYLQMSNEERFDLVLT